MDPLPARRGDFPLLFVHTVRAEAGFRDTEDEDDFIEFLSAGGLVGTLEASGSIRRIAGRRAKVVIGDAATVEREAFLFARSASVRSALRRSTIGLLANFNEVMWSTYVDPYAVFARLGPQLRFISYSDLALEIKEVGNEAARGYVGDLRGRHRVLGDVDESLFPVAETEGRGGTARSDDLLHLLHWPSWAHAGAQPFSRCGWQEARSIALGKR